MGAEIGGIVICRPKPIAYRNGDLIGFRLMSDLHVGAPNVDYDLIKAELEDAKERGDRILLNGDLVDMILPKDLKRFDPSHIHPRLLGRGDVINEQIKWCIELLAPYANQIDMIGCGNHETAVMRHHNFDPTSAIIHGLQQHVTYTDHVIHYGGYCGFIDYRLRYDHPEGGNGQRYVIYYHHGVGGSSPVTKGMTDLYRTGWVGADTIWKSHLHVRVSTHIQTLSCPLTGDEPTYREVRQIRTGSYFDTYRGQSQQSIRETGRRTNWAADCGFSPQGKGGARVMLKMRRSGNDLGYTMVVEQ